MDRLMDGCMNAWTDDGWVGGWMNDEELQHINWSFLSPTVAYCNQSQTNDIKLQTASLSVLMAIGKHKSTQSMNFTDVNAKQTCRKLEGSSQLALCKHSATVDRETLLFLRYQKQWCKPLF